MSCNLTEIRRQLEDMQKIMDEYNCYHRDDEPLDEKAIVERTKQVCIEAVEEVKAKTWALSNNDLGVKKSGINEAIKAIQSIE